MPKQPITIIGAGIAGLTLSRSLLHRGIPSIVFDKAPPNRRGFNYAITLHSTAYKPLLEILNLSDTAFKAHVAIDAEDGGEGKHGENIDIPSHGGLYDTSTSFRANRAKFEDLLGQDLDIRLGYSLQQVNSTPTGPRLRFANGEMWEGGELVVGADGVHSSIRKLLLPEKSRVDVLPYAVYYGKRCIMRKDFNSIFGGRAEGNQGRNVWQTNKGDVVLTVNVDKKEDKKVGVSWIYSRKARGETDPLFNPARSTNAADKIPLEFFKEVRAQKIFGYPYAAMVDVQSMRSDRILHWLMRTTSTPLPELHDLLAKSGVCLLGDAAHAEPILGGNGANASIIDGLSLADAIASGEDDGISNWYNDRYPKWVQGAEESQANLARMHGSLRPGVNL
ncbi:hypothetical protein J4E83_003768 [Alternaria metachromatica]|uniref:uncharacterized protein n=1 Tax=Alternaria metachromatica TaxID=283354 RepID=UPI0020C4B486|nr:uncharacterized protein J4E83_003768 [Alternaria metachromatica]KAI4626616.1 hypothetical protein J4E83_003768 [Alternaria metachromatica]